MVTKFLSGQMIMNNSKLTIFTKEIEQFVFYLICAISYASKISLVSLEKPIIFRPYLGLYWKNMLYITLSLEEHYY
jgi:hypothetical protein